MNVTKEQILDNKIKLTITVPTTEVTKQLERTAKKMSYKNKIKGFRPGNIPYEIVKSYFGEMAIYQESLNSIINFTFIDALKMESVDYVGQPEINVEKLAPGNEIVYTAVFNVMPKVELPENWKEMKLKVEEVIVDDEKVKKEIDKLAIKYSKQILKDGVSKIGDKVLLDFELSFDNVVPEDGVVKGFEVILGEDKMIKGFEENLIGIKTNDKKEFELKFPDDYHRKEYAGKLGKFKINVLYVFTIEKPELNDEFANACGFNKFEELEKSVKDSLLHEMQHIKEHEAEVKMFENLAQHTQFSYIPEQLIESEKDAMINEMNYSMSNQGLNFNDYLMHLKKTVDELKKEMQEDAIKRVKSGLIIKTIRENEKIDVTEEQIDKEINKILNQEGLNKEMQERVKSFQYRMFVKNNLAIQSITKMMKSLLIEGGHSCER